MHAVSRTSVFIIVVGMVSGCCSTMATKPAAPAASVAGANTCVMQSGGVNILKLTMSPDVKCVAKDGSLHFTAPQYEVEVWQVSGVQTVDDALPHVGTQIVDEFKDFKPDHTTDLTIANSPAKQLIGTGHEADDGDPGDADVIVFKVADHIFVACNHGESLTPAGQQGLLTLVQTAQAP